MRFKEYSVKRILCRGVIALRISMARINQVDDPKLVEMQLLMDGSWPGRVAQDRPLAFGSVV